jgi:hypothetical protein
MLCVVAIRVGTLGDGGVLVRVGAAGGLFGQG